MQIGKSKVHNFWTVILIILAVLVWVLSCGNVATADMYAESAHGDTTDGVNRLDVVPDPGHPDAYDIGACAHCHEPHGSSWRLLRTEVNNSLVTWTSPPTKNNPANFCFACHENVSTPHYA